MVRLQIIAALTLLAAAACGPGRDASVQVDDGKALPWLGESMLVVDTEIGIEIVGDARADTITFELAATVSATTAEVAELEAAKVAVILERSTESVIFGLSVPDKKRADIVGKYTFTVPAEFDVQALSNDGGVLVRGIDGDIAVSAAENSRIEDARGDVELQVTQGSAELSTLALQGTNAVVQTQGGQVQVLLPDPLSVEVQVTTTGIIELAHPELPLPPAGAMGGYTAVTRSGLSRLIVAAGSGRVTLGLR